MRGVFWLENKETVFYAEIPDCKKVLGTADKKGFKMLRSLAASENYPDDVPFMAELKKNQKTMIKKTAEKFDLNKAIRRKP